MRNQALLRLLAAGVLGTLLAASRSAPAQSNVNLPLPNVMLLVDSSGSMEWKPGADVYPQCDSTADEHSRWGELLEVLTGSIQNYHCTTVSRSSSTFLGEYSRDGVNPPDYRYQTPYHRPVSTDCTPAPGTSWLSSNPYEFPTDAIIFRQLGSSTRCTFNQLHDGLVSTYGDQVRFGLMTFDTNTDPGTGIGTYQAGVTGTWSYFVGTSGAGHPVGCAEDMPFEVGARNAAAPPWEGRMVPFGKPDMSASELSTKNDQIRQILLATRPFGATPVAGLLNDARDFLKNDKTKSPLDSKVDFGPSADPFVLGGCRQNYLILLTDGEPNLELRPFCEPTGGKCPYQKPEEIATDLANNAVKTFVIGFSLAQVNGKDCGTLDPTADCASSGCYATTGSVQLRACCCLNAIAAAGGTERAYFASDRNTLRAALSKVLADVAKGSTSRTLPVFAPSGGFNSSSRFFTSFVPRQLQLWQGVIERQRYVCEKSDPKKAAEPVLQDFNRSEGDDFIYRVNAHPDTRQFYSVRGSGDPIQSERSIRPVLNDPDGIGEYTGTQYSGGRDTFVSTTFPSAMSLTLANKYCDGLSSPEACRDLYLKWLVGLSNGTAFSRCPVAGSEDCNLVADIFHSTPAVVGPPSERLQDESYQAFTASRSTRPPVLYTSTNDGFLHAFKLPATPETNPAANNELWAFAPPAVLPAIPGEYPGNHGLLLDGAPVVRDVAATQRSGKYYFERASVGERGSDPITWRTVLVQSFGSSRGGYFAVDVTDPDPATTPGGPQFLWQLTTNSAGDPLFGLGGATPLITSLFFDVNSGTDPKEVAVAVLPGGTGGAHNSGPDGTGCATATGSSPLSIGTPGELRPKVWCYPTAGIASRSLTIVRLDNGEIIRSFRATGDPTAGISTARLGTLSSPLNSPITGPPAAFPGSVGTLATQLYVGDADGVLWRVDVTSKNPAEWTMKAFFDAYGRNVPGTGFNVGQPIPNAPKVSTDAMGRVTLAFATGDQQVFQATTGMKTYVWSLTEIAEPSTFGSTANWYKEFADGDRVSGPLYLFNGGIYFSTFKPAAASAGNACVSGDSAVWGMDYVNKPENVTALDQGGAPMLPQADGSSVLVNHIDNTDTRIGADASIFGVTVAQLPTCGDEASTTDSYFGTGQHTAVTNVNVGQYQLIMQTGKAGTTGGSQSSSTAINLALPKVAPRIDSWAAVVEWP
jgi:type IV pilus assembly protein PilY1